MMIAEHLTQKAIQLSMAGQLAEACKLFTEVTLLRPKDSGAWLNLGICYKTLENLPKAVASFDQALEIDVLNASAYSNLAAIAVFRGDVKEAIAVLDNGLRSNNQDPMLLATKGALLAQIGEILQASDLLAQAHNALPNDFTMGLIFAELLVQQQRFREALSVLELQTSPPSPLIDRYYLALGRAKYGCGEIAAAKSAFIHAQAADSVEAGNLLQQIDRGWGELIASKRIVMEPINVTHAPKILQLQQDMQAWTFYNPQGIAASNIASVEQEILRRYTSPSLPPKELAWALYRVGIDSKDFLGLCQLVDIDHHNQRAELLMIVQEHNKGYGVEALLMLAKTYFKQYGLNKLVSLVIDANKPVVDMELRLGFKQEGYWQQHLFNPATQAFSGLIQLALFKEDFEHSEKLKVLIKKFRL